MRITICVNRNKVSYFPGHVTLSDCPLGNRLSYEHDHITLKKVGDDDTFELISASYCCPMHHGTFDEFMQKFPVSKRENDDYVINDRVDVRKNYITYEETFDYKYFTYVIDEKIILPGIVTEEDIGKKTLVFNRTYLGTVLVSGDASGFDFKYEEEYDGNLYITNLKEVLR